jgi:hypothetical protein
MPPETTARKQRGRPFPPGTSGNVAGRPRGSRNRSSVIAEALSDPDVTAIVRAVVAKAKKGDVVAARVLLDRIWPASKSSAVTFPALSATDAHGIIESHALLLRCVADGELTPDEAKAVSGILVAQLRSIETADIDRRLCEVEARVLSE